MHRWKLDAARAFYYLSLRLNLVVHRLEPMALAMLFRFAL